MSKRKHAHREEEDVASELTQRTPPASDAEPEEEEEDENADGLSQASAERRREKAKSTKPKVKSKPVDQPPPKKKARPAHPLDQEEEIEDEPQDAPSNSKVVALKAGDKPKALPADLSSKLVPASGPRQATLTMVPVAAPKAGGVLAHLDKVDAGRLDLGLPMAMKDPDAERPTREEYVEAMKTAATMCMREYVQGKAVKVINPELAVLLWSKQSRSFLHCLELDDIERCTWIVRKEMQRGKDKKETFVNIKCKPPRRDLQGEKAWGFIRLSPFSDIAFLKLGPTEETGVNGNAGKVINGQTITPLKASYSFSITSKSIHPMFEDVNYNNPIASHFISQNKDIALALAKKMVADKKCLSDVRDKFDGLVRGRDPTAKAVKANDPLSFAKWMIKANFFKMRDKETDAKDGPFEQTLGVNDSVWRRVYEADPERPNYVPEPANPPPSAMFEKYTENEEGQPICHKRIPAYRCRRWDEVEEGVEYDSPFIPIPFERAVFTSNDIVMVLLKTGLYEWKMDKAGKTEKPIALIWLNTKDGIMKEKPVPCDPRYAIPLAGVHSGAASLEEVDNGGEEEQQEEEN